VQADSHTSHLQGGPAVRTPDIDWEVDLVDLGNLGSRDRTEGAVDDRDSSHLGRHAADR
jgi:hypothetical protein